MTTFTWNTGSGSFNTGSNWSPAGPPTSADTANFKTSGGTISGTGAVTTLNFQSGASWSVDGQLQGGAINVNDPLTVLNGGVLTLTGTFLDVAGGQNATGSLTINAGGHVVSTVAAQTANDLLLVGGGSSSQGANGTVTVTGSGALLDMGSNPASVGLLGTGTLNVLAGATALSATSNSAIIAALAVSRGGNGTVNVSGAGSSMTANGYVYVGRAGTGALNVDAGGTFTGGSAASGSTSSYGITIGDGSPALDANGNPNSPLYFGGTGTAAVTNSSTLHSIGNLRVGYRGTTGTLHVGSSSVARSDQIVVIGGGTDRTGGDGTVTVDGGGTLVSGGVHITGSAGIVLGNDPGTSGTVTVSGSSSLLDANGDRLTVGGNGAGTLTISSGARALSGSASYSDVEAAFAVAGGTGATGTVTITGAGSQLVASGDAVIGGNEKGSGPSAGGAGSVSVANGGLLQTGAMTIEAGSSLSVDQSSTLTAPRIMLAGGTANLYTLSSATTVNFGKDGTLGLHALSGANTISSLTVGDKIDFAGMTGLSLTNDTITTGTGSLTVNAAPTAASYVLSSDGNGGTYLALNANTIGTYRFFDSTYGTHFFTADANEKNALTSSSSPSYRPDLVEETNGFGAVDPAATDPNEVSVYRFFDQTTGTHFFTASASERDSIMDANSPNYQKSYVYESGSTFFEHGTQQVGDLAVYRFFDSVHGTHFYTGDATEYANITTPGGAGYRADLVSEGVGFYAPAGSYV